MNLLVSQRITNGDEPCRPLPASGANYHLPTTPLRTLLLTAGPSGLRTVLEVSGYSLERYAFESVNSKVAANLV
jgi:hypothetical protein